jgi:hypothetical protein
MNGNLEIKDKETPRMDLRNDPLISDLNGQLKGAVGIKKYQETKKVMANFEIKFKEAVIKDGKVNLKIL